MARGVRGGCNCTQPHAAARARTVRVRERISDVLVVERVELLRERTLALSQEGEVVAGVPLAQPHQATAAREAAELHGRLQLEPGAGVAARVREDDAPAGEQPQPRSMTRHFFKTSCGGVSGVSDGNTSTHAAYAWHRSCATASELFSRSSTSSAFVHRRLPATVSHTASCAGGA
jgi:hypothetical protein